MVPKDMQQAVYGTVKKRGPRTDATWAPWWRAQAAATVFVLRKTHPAHSDRIDKLEQKEEAFAVKLEGR